MNHGLQLMPFARDAEAHSLCAAAAPVAIRRWRALSAERRLALVEQSLARSGVDDGYPLAL